MIHNGIYVPSGKRDCICHGGRVLSYTAPCSCKGQPRVKYARKCKICGGNGYTRLENPIDEGPHSVCGGTGKVEYGMTDNIPQEDKAWIADNLIDFEEPYKGPSHWLDEGYLGLNTLGGITDYGRYKKMSEEEFRKEVREHFTQSWLQGLTIFKKGQMIKRILVRRGESGWFLYGEW